MRREREEELLPLMLLSREELRGLPGALPASGRASPLSLPAGEGRVFVRPYARAGLLAPLRRHGFPGLDRALDELRANARARALGLPVPEMLGFAARRAPSGRWLLDAWTDWVPRARRLAESLRAHADDPARRRRLLERVGEAIGRCQAAGLVHRDLNARNVLVREEGDAVEVLVVDLDRAAFLPHLPRRLRLRQLRRLYRSLVKERALPGALAEGEFLELAARALGGPLRGPARAWFRLRCRLAVLWHRHWW